MCELQRNKVNICSSILLPDPDSIASSICWTILYVIIIINIASRRYSFLYRILIVTYNLLSYSRLCVSIHRTCRVDCDERCSFSIFQRTSKLNILGKQFQFKSYPVTIHDQASILSTWPYHFINQHVYFFRIFVSCWRKTLQTLEIWWLCCVTGCFTLTEL